MNETDEPVAMHEALAFVLFSVGDWRVGVEARQVRASHAAQESAPAGELAAALGFPPVFASPLGRQCLTLKRTAQDKEILVDAPVDLARLPIAAIHALPPLLVARTGLRGLRALAIWPDAGEKTFTLLFDADLF
jgi:hypothetical protein